MIRDTAAEYKAHIFNLKMAKFFNRPPIRLRGIVVNNSEQYAELMGYDFTHEMMAQTDGGGFAITFEDAYLSYNGEIYYPHEIVHLYTERYIGHSWFNEGFATYFGGSMGCSLEEHLNVLAADADSLDFSNIPEFQYYSEWTNVNYAIGGLFIKLAYEEYGGKNSVEILLNSGKTKENFFEAIQEVFEIDQAEINSFVRQKLKNYPDDNIFKK